MTTKTYQCFMLADEFVDVLAATISGANVRVYLQELRPSASLDDITKDVRRIAIMAKRHMLFVGPAPLSPIALPTSNFPTARCGCVVVDPPFGDQGTLFMATIAAKSDWFEPRDRRIHENEDAIALSKRLVVPFKKRATIPTFISWESEPEKRRASRVRCSPDVRAWVDRGGRLRQYGVENVLYSCHVRS